MKSRLTCFPNQVTRLSRRSGFTVAETLIAVVLLGVAVTGVGKLVHNVSQGLQDRELACRIGWEISNARELIGTWSAEDITEARIEQLPISGSVRQALRNAEWETRIVETVRPLAAVRVHLALIGDYRGHTIRPQERIFWVPLSAGATADDPK